MSDYCNSIVLICDDAYVLPTMVTICSLTKNLNCGHNYNIFVCTAGITPDNKYLLEELSSENIKICVKEIDMNQFSDKFKRINQKTHVTPTALIKFELANIFCDFDKVLYLDSDIIINSSIHELLEMDIEEYYLAAAYEFWIALKERYSHPDNSNKFYFNSGVMLLNLSRMRKDNIPARLWEQKILNSSDSSKKTMDQDTLNDVCGGSTKALSIKYNFNPAFSRKVDIKLVNKNFQENYESLNELVSDARIIHYVGKEDKPWIYSSARMRNVWQKYYELINYPKELHLIEARRDLGWYANVVYEVYKTHGIQGLIKYIVIKLRGEK